MFRIHLSAAALVATASLLVAAPATASGKSDQRVAAGVAAKASSTPNGYRGWGYRQWGYRNW